MDASIDLETMALTPDAKILSIGVQVFDRDSYVLGNTLYLHLNWLGRAQESRTFDPNTFKWWMQQSEKARLEILKEEISLYVALVKLKDFLHFNKVDYVWGNGDLFDIGILEHAYRQHEITIPWQFWAPRDLRTLKDIYLRKHPNTDPHILPFEGVQHNALDDATHQAKIIMHCMEYLA